MDDYQIPLSKARLLIQIALGGILVLTALVIVSLFFKRFVTVAPDMQAFLVMSMWIILPVFWAGGSLYLYKSWPKATYILSENALIIQKKSMFGGKSEQLYRYESITTIDCRQNFLTPDGTLTLTLSQLDPVTLYAVADPEAQARKIKDTIASKYPRVKTIPK